MMGVITDPYEFTKCTDCVHYDGRDTNYFGSCGTCEHNGELSSYFYNKIYAKEHEEDEE